MGNAQKAGSLLSKHKDYLYSHDREELRAFLRSERIINKNYLWMLYGRARKLRQNAVPGIFREEFENSTEKPLVDRHGDNYHRFPTVDYIINLFSNHLKSAESKSKYDTYAGKCSLEDIINFRSYAARDGKIDKRVAKECGYRTNRLLNSYELPKESKQFILEKSGQVIEDLAKLLSTMPSQKPFWEYNPQDNRGKDPFRIVHRPFWYAHYSNESVTAILKAYASAAVDRANSSTKERYDFSGRAGAFRDCSLLVKLFPEVIADIKARIN